MTLKKRVPNWYIIAFIVFIIVLCLVSIYPESELLYALAKVCIIVMSIVAAKIILH